jgi:hypothetical protein
VRGDLGALLLLEVGEEQESCELAGVHPRPSPVMAGSRE